MSLSSKKFERVLSRRFSGSVSNCKFSRGFDNFDYSLFLFFHRCASLSADTRFVSLKQFRVKRRRVVRFSDFN